MLSECGNQIEFNHKNKLCVLMTLQTDIVLLYMHGLHGDMSSFRHHGLMIKAITAMIMKFIHTHYSSKIFIKHLTYVW